MYTHEREERRAWQTDEHANHKDLRSMEYSAEQNQQILFNQLII